MLRAHTCVAIIHTFRCSSCYYGGSLVYTAQVERSDDAERRTFLLFLKYCTIKLLAAVVESEQLTSVEQSLRADNIYYYTRRRITSVPPKSTIHDLTRQIAKNVRGSPSA